MRVKELISRQQQDEKTAEAITVRIPATYVTHLDEISSSLGVTRQLLLTDMIKDAVDVALEDYKNSQNNHPEAMAHDEKPVSGSRFFMLNTNKRNNEDDHRDMVTNGVAAAFYHPWKEEIAKIKEGSVVFLYENGVGIVGTGVAPSEVEKAEYQGQPGEAYRKKLVDYRRVKPLNAKEIKKVVGGNLVFLRTLVGVSTEYGQKILKNLKDA